ncbi:hypothetical protein L1887_24943 [Cichorium endivia]|nr:hypothetical protein L1887_24943 [Cichorium endivia]
MGSHIALLVLFSLVVIMITVNARPNPEEYMQDSHIQGGSLVSPNPTKRSVCDTLMEANNQRKSSNDNSASLKGTKTFDEEFVLPKPTLWVYENDAGLKDKKTFDEEFEPRPSVTAYKG